MTLPVLKVGYDLDAVLTNGFDRTCAAYLIAERGWTPEQCPPALTWEFYVDWGYDLAWFIAMCDDAFDAGYLLRQDKPNPGAAAAVNSLLDAGHEVHVITDRRIRPLEVVEPITRDWLSLHGMGGVTSLTISADKTCVPCDLYLDDKPANVEAVLAAGRWAYLLDRPWNAHRTDLPREPTVEAYTALAHQLALVMPVPVPA